MREKLLNENVNMAIPTTVNQTTKMTVAIWMMMTTMSMIVAQMIMMMMRVIRIVTTGVTMK